MGPSITIVTLMTTMVTVVIAIIVTIVWINTVSFTTPRESSDTVSDGTCHVEELVDGVAGMKSIPTATLLITRWTTMIGRWWRRWRTHWRMMIVIAIVNAVQ